MQRNDLDNCWVVFTGEALVNKTAKPALVFVTPKFNQRLYNCEPSAWQGLIEYSEDLIKSEADESHSS